MTVIIYSYRCIASPARGAWCPCVPFRRGKLMPMDEKLTAPLVADSSLPGSIPLRPLDALQIPPELDGRTGDNRADPARLQINATCDADAIRCFLVEYDRSPGTLRIYQRECERLLLWSLVECGKPLSSLNRQDFEGYLNFLVDPQPAALWCGPKAERASDKWRPFVGPLSESAVLTAMAAINSLMRYLVDAGYLLGNPLGLIRQRRRKMAAEAGGPLRAVASTEEVDKIERFLDEQMWQAVTAAIEAMPRDAERGPRRIRAGALHRRDALHAGAPGRRAREPPP